MMVGIILVPIYLVYIPKDLYGYWLATGNILTIISLLDPGIGGVVTQKFHIIMVRWIVVLLVVIVLMEFY